MEMGDRATPADRQVALLRFRHLRKEHIRAEGQWEVEAEAEDSSGPSSPRLRRLALPANAENRGARQGESRPTNPVEPLRREVSDCVCSEHGSSGLLKNPLLRRT